MGSSVRPEPSWLDKWIGPLMGVDPYNTGRALPGAPVAAPADATAAPRVVAKPSGTVGPAQPQPQQGSWLDRFVEGSNGSHGGDTPANYALNAMVLPAVLRAGAATARALQNHQPGSAALQALAAAPMLLPEGAVGKVFSRLLGKSASPFEKFSVITAQNPLGHAASAAENEAANAALEADLRGAGHSPIPVTGRYPDDKTGELLSEQGFMVPGMRAEDAKAFGRKYQQNSILTEQGLHSLADNQLYPATGLRETAAGDAAHTEMPNGKKFSMDLDFANPRAMADSVAARGAQRAYHGTYQMFDQFAEPGEKDLGIHLGKVEQAKARLVQTQTLPLNRSGNPALLAVEHNIKNPLRLDDLNTWSLPEVKEGLRNSPSFTPQEVNSLRSLSDARKLIRSKGFDGIVYDNQSEARGSGDSYIALSPSDVKVLGNAEDFPEIPSAMADSVIAHAPAVLTRPSSGDVFDTSRLGTQLPPGVNTDRPPVRYPTDRADVSMLKDVPRKFRQVYTPNAAKQLVADPRAAGWYDMSQLRDAMANESPTGADDFKKFMLFMGPTSSGTKVPENLRQASKFFQLWKSGELNPQDLENGTLNLPPGYSNRRQAGINSGIQKILTTGNLDPIETPKTFRYANQLAGDMWGGAALDMHVGRQVGKQGLMMDADKNLIPTTGFPQSSYPENRRVGSSPNNLHYPIIEDALIREANKLGLTPAQYQALGWVGGGPMTGVSDTRPLLQILNEKLRSTATKYGYPSPLDAFKAFARGQTPLWALGGIGAGLGAGGLLQNDPQQQQP